MGNRVTEADVLIVGQGLAGSTLAWALAERGVSVVVVDRGGAGGPSASRVAAGLITPVTGKRLTVAPGYAEQSKVARRFYQTVVEARVGAELLSVAPAVRLFRDAEERALYERRHAAEPAVADASRPLELGEAPDGIDDQFGGFVMPTAMRLSVGRYLDGTAAWLEREGRLRIGHCDADELLAGRGPRDRDGRLPIEACGVSARMVVVCDGFHSIHRRERFGVELAPAKGEVLTVELPTYRDPRVVHRGVWIAPDESGVPGRYRVGATYEWDDLSCLPTDAGKRELLGRLAEAGLTDATVIDHQAAIRPATARREPTWGFVESDPCVGWLNGLGAKGSLWAPTYAARMADAVAERLG